MSLRDVALRRALHERSIYRTMSLAALDQLREQTLTIANQQRLIQEMRDERDRYARSIFRLPPSDGRAVLSGPETEAAQFRACPEGNSEALTGGQAKL